MNFNHQTFERSNYGRSRSHWPTAVAVILVAILINSVTLISAFEAHVVNVTATIERRPSQCDALSPGYWRNHEGCNQGGGESLWTAPINALSATFSGVFTNYTGEGICAAEWQPNCPSSGIRAGRLCRAKLHTLADELNVVSGHLDLDALIAGADRGGGSFDRLGLSPSSTVSEALAAIERVIARHEADVTLDGREWLADAAQVAERIYSFYEDENPIAPQCIFNLNETTINDLSLNQATSTEATTTPIIIETEEMIVAPTAIKEVAEATTTLEVIEAVVEDTTEEITEVIEETITEEVIAPVEVEVEIESNEEVAPPPEGPEESIPATAD